MPSEQQTTPRDGLHHYLKLSTRNVTAETMNAMIAWAKVQQVVGYPFYPVASVYPDGVFLWVPHTKIDTRLPQELVDILTFAQAHECSLVQLDRFTETVEGFPVYEP